MYLCSHNLCCLGSVVSANEEGNGQMEHIHEVLLCMRCSAKPNAIGVIRVKYQDAIQNRSMLLILIFGCHKVSLWDQMEIGSGQKLH